MKDELIKSKERVKNHGEVFTPAKEVNAMLDLVNKYQKETLTRTYLEPACGNGNFLAPILERKLDLIKKSKVKYPQILYSIIQALSSIYAIDIQQDNVQETRDRLLLIVQNFLKRRVPKNQKDATDYKRFLTSISFILSNNIVHGDSLNKFFEVSFVEYTFNEEMVTITPFKLADLKEDKVDVSEDLFSLPDSNQLTEPVTKHYLDL